MENLGFILALTAALSWGTYMVPFKLSKSGDSIQFQALMGIGILISTIILCLILGYPLSLNYFGLIAGVMWSLANVTSLIAVANIGLSKAMPIIASLVILATFSWGTLVFGELPNGILMGVLGIIVIIFGVILVSTTQVSQSHNFKTGFLSAIVSGLIFGSQLVPLKVGHVLTKDFFFSTGLSIFLTGFCIFLIKKAKFKNEAIKGSIFSGMIWSIGNIASIISISLIGLSKTIPITQSACLIGVLWGLIYFHEVKEKRFKVQILIGALILIAGVAILGSA